MLYLNNVPVNVTLFPDNTSQVWKLTNLPKSAGERIVIKWEFTHEGELPQLAQLVYLLKNQCWQSWSYNRPVLEMPYLPYARQDKNVDNLSTFGLATFIDFINSLGFSEVHVLDPHNISAAKRIEHLVIKWPMEMWHKVVEQVKPDAVCFPDDGARHKYAMYFSWTGHRYAAKKFRHGTTGILEFNGFNMMGVPSHGKRVLIIDDICDGGATFTQLANELKKVGVEDIFLFVTHGIFSKGLKPLFDAGIKRIFTNKGEAYEFQNYTCYATL